jgi:tungstate transport system substrate-binding protein
MAATLRLTSEKRGHTLSDRSTFLTLGPALGLDILVAGGDSLVNRYHVLVVDPRRHPGVNAAGGRALADFLTSAQVQERIAEFGRERHGRPLFTADAGPKP